MPEYTDALIIKYLEHTLTDEEATLLLEWLQASEQNKEFLLTCKKIYALGKIRQYTDPLHLNNALQTFTQRTKYTKEIHFQSWTRYSKYAAMILLVIAIPVLLWITLYEKPVQYTTVTVDNIEPLKTVILPDGSRVWVNNESSLTFPAKFEGSERNVSLRGEAFFDVKSDSLHPFIVKTNSMHVKVYGTSFNVNAGLADSTIQTTLVSGQVAIGDDKGNNLAMLKPGQLAIFNRQSKKIEIHQVNTDQYTLWRKGLVVFEKANLPEITNKLENIYNIKITINAESKVQNRINFVFRKSQPIDTVLNMLEFVAPIKYKKYDDQVYINLK